MTPRELKTLIKHFKELVELDIVGITSTDARNTITSWLEEIGQEENAWKFDSEVYKYQSSPKIVKEQMEYRP